MEKTGNTIYKVIVTGVQGEHYFGSLAAIFDTFTYEQIGIKLSSLWRNPALAQYSEYRNNKVHICKASLIRKKTNRGKVH